MKKINDVPRATLATHVKSVDPTGGFKLNAVPPGMTTPILTGCTAPSNPLNTKGLHCCKAVFSWNANATPGSVELQEPPFEGATVIKLEVPPVLNPVESDMVSTICSFFCIGSVTENEPCPLLNAVSGIETFLGVPNTGIMSSWNGGVPPVHETERSSHSEGVPDVNVKPPT